MKKIYKLFLVLLIILYCQIAMAENKQFERLIIFGDDYSDTGNTYRATQHLIPTSARYYHGRFSNGPLWSDYFAKMINIPSTDKSRFLNFSYGNAEIFRSVTKILHDKNVSKYVAPNLGTQIYRFNKNYHNFTEQDLVVVFIGNNDFIPFMRLKTDSFFKDLADQETAQIKNLIKLGAQNIIVVNVRDLTQTPYSYRIKKKTFLPLVHQYSDDLRQQINNFNSRLAANLKAVPSIYIYDLYQFDSNIFSAIEKKGFSYRFENKNYVLSQQQNKPCYQNNGDYQNSVGSVCDKPSEYFYYDNIHTTYFVNYLLAKDIYKNYFNL